MLPLFASQKSLYYFEKLNPQTAVYHHTFSSKIVGKLDVGLLTQALLFLTKRHEILRSGVEETHQEIYFKPIFESDVHKDNLPFQIIQLDHKTFVEPDHLFSLLKNTKLEHLATEPFDLLKGPLWRVLLLQFGPNQFQLLFVFHHLIIDISSQNIIIDELSKIYNALLTNKAIDLPNNLTLHEIKKNESESIENKKLQYWSEKLNNLASFSLLTDYHAQKPFQFKGDRLSFHIEKKVIDELSELANKSQSTLSSALLSGFLLLMCRYSQEWDICVGFASSNRRGYVENVDHTLNCFMNSIPLRIVANKDITFLNLVSLVNQELKNALINQLPLDLVMQKSLNIETKSSLDLSTPFNIFYNFNNEKKSFYFLKTECSEPYELNLEYCKFKFFGINCNIQKDGSAFGFIDFNTDLFKKASIQSLINRLMTLWQSLSNNNLLPIDSIPILSHQDQLHLDHYAPYDEPTPYEDHFSLIFKRVAKRNANKTAIVFHHENNVIEKISFKKLNQMTDALAAYLQNIGIGPEKTIGICLNRSMNLFVSFIAILKAGGVIVPLETSINTDNISDSSLFHKITDTMIDTVIVDHQTSGLFQHAHSKLFRLNIDDQTIQHVIKSLGLSCRPPKLLQNHLAYIMYTSGTTGKPKGVMIEHAGLTNLAYALLDRNLKKNSNSLCNAPPTFDCFIFEILEWLALEGEMHVINEKERLSPEKQIQVINDHHIECAALLPDILKNLSPNELPSLRDVISMGATPHQNILEEWLATGKTIRNEYGPTETTICSTENPYHVGQSFTNIGKPIRNTKMLVLDPNFKQCPIGVPGELFIAGMGLARGYVGNSELSTKKFPKMIYDPATYAFYPLSDKNQTCPKPLKLSGRKRKRSDYIEKPCKENTSSLNIIRLYATGDLAAYAVDKNGQITLDFLGRKDRQIKIHGVRIEIDGLEAILRNHPAIQDVYVTINDHKTALISYIVPQPHSDVSEGDIQHYLKQKSVPPIAWPQTIIMLNQLPINKNGKIDFRALPKPVLKAPATTHPATALQKALAQIWSQVLDREVLDTNKTFRQYGGDSLSLAILETTLNQNLTLKEHIGFDILNSQLTILELEKMIQSFILADQNTLSYPCGLSGSQMTLFAQSTTPAFEPVLQPFFSIKNSFLEN